MISLSEIKTVLISRTDSIGDVVLTLPMAGVLKEILPGVKIVFLGRNYTRDVVGLSIHIDEFISYDELLPMSDNEKIKLIQSKAIDCVIHVFPKKEIASLFKRAGIPLRVGTTNRLFHWNTCNKLIRLSRKKSDLHEAQLNLKLIRFAGAKEKYSIAEITNYYGFEKIPQLNSDLKALLDQNKKRIILHPKSKGSAREWGLENFSKLIGLLSREKYQVFVSGTKEEGELMKNFLKENPEVIDLTGKMNLAQFITFIQSCDALVAASTGPLHIAAALGKRAIGLFAPMRPIHPGRWAPLGKQADYLVLDKGCEACRKTNDCSCIRSIEAAKVKEKIDY